MNSTVHGILQARILEWVAFPFSRVSFQSRVEPRSPALQMDSLLAEPPGKPRADLVLQKNLVESPRELPYAVDPSYWLLESQVTQLVKENPSVNAGDARDVG